MKQTIYNATGDKIDYQIDYEEVNGLKFHNVGRVISKRIKSFYTKEPKTLEWINSFKSNSNFVDIGANIGVYSLYAGQQGHNVYAFEPQALNFAELYTNIYLNNLQNKIQGYGFALSNVNSIEYLSLMSMVPGQSHNDYAIDKPNQLKQGCVGFTLDHLIETKVIPQPDYIKIDVDGIELKVIQGAIETIKKCKSVLVELTDVNVLKTIKDLNFIVDENMTYKLSETETNYVCNSRSII